MSKLTIVQGPIGGVQTFATVADLAAEVNATLSGGEGDPVADRLSSLLASACAIVADYIGRPILQQTVSETFGADDIPELFEVRRRDPVLCLTMIPVLEIEQLTVPGGLYDPGPCGFDLDTDAGILHLPFGFGRYLGGSRPRLTVQYRGGWLPAGTDPEVAQGPTVPETIRRSAIEYAALLWLRTGPNRRDPTILRETTTDVGMTEYAPALAQNLSGLPLPTDIAARLSGYKDVRL